MTQTERDLVMSYQTAVDKVTELEETLKTAKKAKDACEKNLLDHLETTGAEKTATYEGLGYVTRVKPRLYARCNEESKELLFSFLELIGREDVIKSTVHSSSLSSIVAERIEAGDEVPEFIPYYMKPGVRFYGTK